jgi:hypothetical protein
MKQALILYVQNAKHSQIFQNMKCRILVAFFMLFIISCELEEKNFIKPKPEASLPTEISAVSFKAHWKKLLGAQSYIIQVSENDNFSTMVLGYESKEVTDTITIVQNLKANTNYYYRVKFRRANTLSESSNVIKTTTSTLDIPHALSAQNIDQVGFKAIWNKVIGVEKYRLYISESTTFESHVAQYNGYELSDTSITINDLNVNTDYFYKIIAVSQNAASAPSNVIKVRTSMLGKPNTTNATEITQSSFKANWEAVYGADAYLLEVATDASFLNSHVEGYKAKEVKSLSETVVGLNANSKYYYRIKAISNGQISDISELMTVTTQSIAAPILEQATDATFQSFLLQWNEVSNASSFLVDIANDAEFKNMAYGYNALEVFSNILTTNGLTPNKKYYCRIRAFGLNSLSDYSNVVTINTLKIPAPAAMDATDVTKFSFVAHWTEIPGITQYQIDVANDKNFTQKVLGYDARIVSAATQILVEGLLPNTTYFYRIRAIEANAESDNSQVIGIKTEALLAPLALPATNQTIFTVTANWDEVDGALSYVFDLATDADFTQPVEGFFNKEVVGKSLKIDGLHYRNNYYYRIRSKRVSSLSEYSNTVIIAKAISDKVRFISSIDPKNKMNNEFIYNDLGQVEEIRNHRVGFDDRKYLITYTSDNTIASAECWVYNKLRGYVFTESWKFNRSNNQLSGITIKSATDALVQDIVFGYDEKGRINRKIKYSNAEHTAIIDDFLFTYDANNNITKASCLVGSNLGDYENLYDNKLNPFQLLHPELAHFIITPRAVSNTNPLIYPCFSFNNLTAEKTPTSLYEVYVYNYDPLEIPLERFGYYAAKFTFTDLNN